MHDSTDLNSEQTINPADAELADRMEHDPSQDPGVNFRPAPTAPSLKEIQRHNITHLPYEPWCTTCVASKGTDDAHRRRVPGHSQDPAQMAKVSYDYAFFRARPGSSPIPALIGVCKKTALKTADIVRDRHGRLPSTIQAVDNGLKTMGHHGAVTLRSDGEPALQDLLRSVAARRRAVTLVEHGPRGDGQANGLVERAIRSVEEHTRAIKRDLEKRLEATLDPEHNIFSWILRHATDLLNKYAVGVDGKTAWQRLRGTPYRGEMLSFGARVLHRMSGKMQGGLLVDRWTLGHWIGKNSLSDEHLVLTDAGTVIRARSVRSLDKKMVLAELLRAPPCSSGSPPTLNTENLDDGVGMRSEPPPSREQAHAGEPGAGGFDHTMEPELRKEKDKDDQQQADLRQWRISTSMLRKHGYSSGCKGCKAVESGQKAQSHTAECRMRLEKAMKGDATMEARFADSAARRRVRLTSDRDGEYNQGRPCGSRGVEHESAEPALPDNVVDAAAAKTAEEIPVGQPNVEPEKAEDVDMVSPDSDRKRGRADSLGDEAVAKAARTAGDEDMDVAVMTRCPNSEPSPEMFQGDGRTDEVEGHELNVPANLITEAKRIEWNQLVDMSTFVVVDRPADTKVIGTRWVLVNKGSPQTPRVKARLVAKDFWRKEGSGNMFSGTPNLSAIKFLLTDLTTNCDGRVIMLADVKGAFLYGAVHRDVLIEVPSESGVGQDKVGTQEPLRAARRPADLEEARRLNPVLSRFFRITHSARSPTPRRKEHHDKHPCG